MYILRTSLENEWDSRIIKTFSSPTILRKESPASAGRKTSTAALIFFPFQSKMTSVSIS